MVKIILYGLISVLLRNNMIYVVLVLFILSILSLIFKFNKVTTLKIPVCIFAIIIFSIIINKILFPCIGITSKDTFKETIPVPVNQIASVYNNDFESLSLEQRELIKCYLPTVEKFSPRFADRVKFDFDMDFYNEQPEIFWNLYFDLFKAYPLRYISAFLDLNIVYWYPFSNFPDEFSQRTYIESWILETSKYPLVRESKFPALLDSYEKIATFSAEWMRLPLLYQYFSLSFPFISMFICLFICIKDKRTDMTLILGCFILLFLTYLLGPVSNFRYVYTFYLAMPYYITLCLFTDKSISNK